MLQTEIFKHFTVVNVVHQKLGTSCVHTTQRHREATSPAQQQVQHILSQQSRKAVLVQT